MTSFVIASMRLACFVPLLAAACFAQSGDPQLVWEGEVDGVSILHVRGNRIDVEDRQGMPVQRDRHRFYSRLPEQRQTVQMQVLQGRGNVRIVQQPRPENNYTLSVQIQDQSGGRSLYSLAFFWDAGSRSPWPTSPRAPSPARRAGAGEESLTWSGRVDDETIVECRADECRTQSLRGMSVSRERFQFSRPLPSREVRVSLENIDGRGEVQLIENPSPGNGYTARVRIRDTQGGQDDYSFTLFWNPPARNEPDRLFSRPGMTWQGRVDGVVRVTVAGDQAFSQVMNGAPVQDENWRFSRGLPPGSAPNAAVRKVRGRGKVEIVEFPSNRNGGRLIFEINDSSGGADHYEVEVGW